MRNLWKVLVLMALVGFACTARDVGQAGVSTDGGFVPSVTRDAGDQFADVAVGRPDYGNVYTSPDAQAVINDYLAVLQSSTDMTTDELFAAHYKERPYLEKVGFDALKAVYLDLIDGAYALTKPEKDMLASQGFMVSDRVRFDSHPMAYMDLYVKDLPVLITTDSILFAIHKSYDLMLKTLEEIALIPMLDGVLSKAHAHLTAGYPGASGITADAVSDADLFFTVARSLLNGAPVRPQLPANTAKRDDLLARVESLQPSPIELFGRPYPCEDCAYDFSQFKPRGHYTESKELQQYFRAMIWLGRTELVLTRYQRELIASWLMWDAVKQAGARPTWQAIDRAIQAFVGKSDNLTMDGMDKFTTEHPATLQELADAATAGQLMDAMEKGGYADQRIMSQIMMTDPLSGTPTVLPPIFEFFGQRFAVDSYVFSNVVYDRIVFEGAKQLRYMPSPLDAMFVLGFQEALPLLKSELDTWHYAQNLHVLKYLVDDYDGSFWGESMYNVWLDAIRELAADTTAAGYPDAVRTRAYARKSMNAGLASWAELRHDTILYVKQSYSGETCDYPDGYVEPFPVFFRKIETFARTSAALFDGLDLPGDAQYLKPEVKAYFDNLATVGATLGAIAEKEVAQLPRLPEETAFIKSIVKLDGMCGGPPFTGWYRDLFFKATGKTFDFKPTVADVHTDPNEPAVLHVATGRPAIMVLVANTSCGQKAYAGPSSSYYEFAEPGFTRLTDEEWMSRLEAVAPPRPAWTTDFAIAK